MSAYRTDEGFERTMLRDDARIARYVEREARGSVRPAPFVMRDVEARNACYHQASNRHGRIRFMKLFLRLVREHVPEGVETYIATVKPRAFVLPLAEADKIDLPRLKAFARQAVGNRNGIAIIEPALFLGCDAYGPHGGRNVVVWHVHLVLWDVTEAELKACRKALGPRHVDMIGRSALWFRKITRDELEIYARYFCKAPVTSYSLHQLRGGTVNRQTGEVLLNYKQNKRSLRTGELVQLANVMNDLFTCDLVFGSGQGGPLARKLILELTAARRREDAREAAQRSMQRWTRMAPSAAPSSVASRRIERPHRSA